MNNHSAAVAIVFLLIPPVSFADVSNPVPPPNYAYGMPLDIARIVSLEEPDSRTCKVVEAKMTYLNSLGQLKTLTYRKHADVCSNN
ncbi:DUF2790 domain-containing protein [Pseudomonas sp. B329]|nr:DUF2790 domain-containing protein [Pseudomonas sp. B329]